MDPKERDHIETAIGCLEDSVNLFDEPDAKPDQFQLHSGLPFMAKHLKKLSEELYRLKCELEKRS